MTVRDNGTTQAGASGHRYSLQDWVNLITNFAPDLKLNMEY